MKKLIMIYFLLLFSFISTLYSQQKQKIDDVFLCKPDKNQIILDENYSFLDSNYNYYDEANRIDALANKYIGENKRSDSYFFDKYQSNLEGFTKLKPGNEFYISTYNNVFKSKIIGYQLWDNVPMGYSFNPVLENQLSLKEDTSDYNRNLFICSKYENISTINLKGIEDKETIKKVTAFLKEYEDKIEYDKESETIDDPAEIKVFEANFLNSDKREYAVSYRKRVAFDKYASGIFIVNEIGKIAVTVVEFKTEFNYYMLLGVVDYNGDGQYELLGENGYYEGIGYELYKNNAGKYEIIAAGFYWGV
ncbi:MAG: hypothetical protein WC358_02805 [Ignavibacteria bacterium]|jgi:hypothetical protein